MKYSKILSIIVPSYNMEAYLPKCLGSLIVEDKELLQKLDVIVVNDGSKDRTSEIAHGFEAKYPGVFRVIDKANGHYGSCINAALPVVRGVFVKVLDSDDYVDTGAFKTLLVGICDEMSQKSSDVDLIVSDYADVTPDGTIIKQSQYWKESRVAVLDDAPQPKERITIHSICYRTELLHRINYKQSEGMPYTDTEWIIEPMAFVRRFRYIPIVVTQYLVGRNGQTMNPDVFARSFQSVLTITIRLVARYADNIKICVPTSVQYYYSQIIFMLSMSYSMGLFGFGHRRMCCDLEAFDNKLSNYAKFYAATAGFVRGVESNIYKFYYVADWRGRHKSPIGFIRYWFGMFLVWILETLRRSK